MDSRLLRNLTKCSKLGTEDERNMNHYPTLPKLGLRISSPQMLEGSLGKHHTIGGDEPAIGIAAKRCKVLRRSPPASVTSYTPSSSRLSTPSTIATSVESGEEPVDVIETQRLPCLYANIMEMGSIRRSEALRKLSSIHRAKVGLDMST